MEDIGSDEEQSEKDTSVSAPNHQGLTNKQVNGICKKQAFEDASQDESVRGGCKRRKKSWIQESSEDASSDGEESTDEAEFP